MSSYNTRVENTVSTKSFAKIFLRLNIFENNLVTFSCFCLRNCSLLRINLNNARNNKRKILNYKIFYHSSDTWIRMTFIFNDAFWNRQRKIFGHYQFEGLSVLTDIRNGNVSKPHRVAIWTLNEYLSSGSAFPSIRMHNTCTIAYKNK